MNRSPRPLGTPLTYERSLLVTLGGLAISLPVVIWITQGDRSPNWPWTAWLLFFCLPISGAVILIFASIASPQKIKSSVKIYNPGGLVLMLIALPVHALLKSFDAKRRKKVGRAVLSAPRAHNRFSPAHISTRKQSKQPPHK